MSMEASQGRTCIHSEFVYLAGSSWAVGPQLQDLAGGLGCSVPAPRGSRGLSLGVEGGAASAEGRKASSAGWRNPAKPKSPGKAGGHSPAADPPNPQLRLPSGLSLSPGCAECGTFPD